MKEIHISLSILLYFCYIYGKGAKSFKDILLNLKKELVNTLIL